MFAGLASSIRGARPWAIAVMASVGLLAASDARAQLDEGPPARALTGVLKRIKETGGVRLGYREGAVPFAFTGRDGTPYGYSIDLCQAIVQDIAEAIGASSLRVEYRRVTVIDRIDQVVDGRIDFECGATTNTAERRARVAFSPLIFVAGTRLLVKRGSAIRSERDLPGRRVVVARGTTNESAMRNLAARQGRAFDLLVAEDFAQAFENVATGAADALAADDILIAGFLADKDTRGTYALVGELLSYEPYGILFARGDAPLAEAVAAAFRRLAATREIRWIYDKWFLRPLPSGVRLGLPMSRQLERSFEVLGLPVQ
jgi:glutamate/aspartate transport system substrate-binding protein